MTWQKHPAVPPSVAAAVSESLLGDTPSIQGDDASALIVSSLIQGPCRAPKQPFDAADHLK